MNSYINLYNLALGRNPKTTVYQRKQLLFIRDIRSYSTVNKLSR